MASTMALAIAHYDIITTLTELWTLLVNLAIADEESLLLPPHPEKYFSVPVALEAGLSEEAIGVMRLLPYLKDQQFEFLPSTYPECWAQTDSDRWGYNYQHRQQLYSVNDELMPASAFKLSFTNIYTYEFVYDTANRLVYPWIPWEDPADKPAYQHVTGKPARDVFGPVISAYKTLAYLSPGEGFVEFRTDSQEHHEIYWAGGPHRNRSEKGLRDWYRDYEEWKALQKLKDIYMECGWDINAKGSFQPHFRKDEFVIRRDKYWSEVRSRIDKMEEEDEAELADEL